MNQSCKAFMHESTMICLDVSLKCTDNCETTKITRTDDKCSDRMFKIGNDIMVSLTIVEENVWLTVKRDGFRGITEEFNKGI